MNGGRDTPIFQDCTYVGEGRGGEKGEMGGDIC